MGLYMSGLVDKVGRCGNRLNLLFKDHRMFGVLLYYGSRGFIDLLVVPRGHLMLGFKRMLGCPWMNVQSNGKRKNNGCFIKFD